LAQTEQTEEGILRFANRYGTLQPWMHIVTYSDWIGAIYWLRETVTIWDMVQKGDRVGLAKAFEWRGERVFYRGTPKTHASPGQPTGDLLHEPVDFWDQIGELVAQSHIRKGDLIRPALLWVLGQINANLRQHNGPALFWDPRRSQIVYQDISVNLIGFIWLQFAQAVHAGKQSRQCCACGRWFEIAKGASRTDRLTCSNTCRTRVYRRRQEQAREMRAQGKPVRAIAKELGSDVETVKRWLSTGKE
jgi:hypothetical protein